MVSGDEKQEEKEFKEDKKIAKRKRSKSLTGEHLPKLFLYALMYTNI